MADVAFMPESDVLDRRHKIAPQKSCKAGKIFGDNGITLVRHGATSLLANFERLLSFTHLASLKMADLDSQSFKSCSQECKSRKNFRMAVPWNNLGCNVFRLEAQLFCNESFDLGRKRRVCSHSPA